MIDIPCICGHPEKEHYAEGEGFVIGIEYGTHWCSGCIGKPGAFHTFTLDNLSLIEQVAAERNLI
jgi:hypothetical protein